MAIQLLTSPADFERMAMIEFGRAANRWLPTVAGKVEKYVAASLLAALQQTEEYKSISQGVLNPHFGFRDGSNRANAIIQAAAESVRVVPINVRYRSGGLTGGLEVTAIKSTFEDLFSLPNASVETRKGVSLPWLEWMLIRGDSIIISDYGMSDIGTYKGSRSGEALMFKGKSGFKIPIGVSGTLQDNWFTRCVATIEAQLDLAIQNALA